MLKVTRISHEHVSLTWSFLQREKKDLFIQYLGNQEHNYTINY